MLETCYIKHLKLSVVCKVNSMHCSLCLTIWQHLSCVCKTFTYWYERISLSVSMPSHWEEVTMLQLWSEFMSQKLQGGQYLFKVHPQADCSIVKAML